MTKPTAKQLATGIEPLLTICRSAPGGALHLPASDRVRHDGLRPWPGVRRDRTQSARPLHRTRRWRQQNADGITAALGSPAPHGFSVGRSINSITISGTCGKVRSGSLPNRGWSPASDRRSDFLDQRASSRSGSHCPRSGS